MRRWSKLQREIYKIVAKNINLQIHCVAYRMDSHCGSTDLPRYWITLDKEIIFDYPKRFLSDEGWKYVYEEHDNYPYMTDIPDITDLIKEYIDTPKDELLTKVFYSDNWGLVDILRAADRRIGIRRHTIFKNYANIAAQKVIKARFIASK
ncbi:MAG: hypothetical protein LBH05_02245 [Deferribacteraceae bacterium]|jgi:hypothetical protein|nr:hypothetical protein [Deferribacteraceae bacterium]